MDVWTVSLAVPRPITLSAAEAERAARFRFEDDRVRWTRAHSALRTILADYAGVEAEQLCFEAGPHGKPSLVGVTGVEFNLSHAGDWAMIAVCRIAPVGIDLERHRPKIDLAPLLARLGETNLPTSHAELLQAWTDREAKSKAAGGALFDQPSARARVVPVRAPENYAASVALIGYIPGISHCGTGS